MKSFNKTIAKIFIIAFILFSASCNRCEKGSGNVIRVSRTVSPFRSIILDGSFNLFLYQDSVQKVEIVSDDNIVPVIDTEVFGDELKISCRRNRCFRRATRLDVYVSVPSIQNITLDGSGGIQGRGMFKGDNISVRIKGSGNVALAVDAAGFTASIDGSGKMDLSGKADNGSYSISGSGNIDAATLTAKSVFASISGSGNIDVTATNTLNAVISGSGDISYYGNPAVRSSVSGSGSVHQK